MSILKTAWHKRTIIYSCSLFSGWLGTGQSRLGLAGWLYLWLFCFTCSSFLRAVLRFALCVCVCVCVFAGAQAEVAAASLGKFLQQWQKLWENRWKGVIFIRNRHEISIVPLALTFHWTNCVTNPNMSAVCRCTPHLWDCGKGKCISCAKKWKKYDQYFSFIQFSTNIRYCFYYSSSFNYS